MRILAFLGLALSLLAAGAAFASDCETQCGGTYCGATNDSDAWKCDSDRRTCIQSCLSEEQNRRDQNNGGNYSAGPSRPVPHAFGAIAYSDATGQYAITHHFTTQAEAERNAVGVCNQKAGKGDCKILLWFDRACGSIARASNLVSGTGWAENGSAPAERYAMQVCQQGGGADCRVIETVCSKP